MSQSTFLVLAAGGSTRMGRPKPLLSLDGRPLVVRAVAAVRDAGARPLVVLGHRAELVAQAVDCDTVVNESWERGLGSSIAAGVANARRSSSIGVLAVDQPLIGPRHLRRLIDEVDAGHTAAATLIDGRIRGIPAVFSPALYDELERLEGDRGARDILRSDRFDIVAIDGVDPRDFDTPESWRAFLEERDAAN